MPRLAENLATLESFLAQPPLAVVPYLSQGQPPDPRVLREAAQRLTTAATG
jgi:hypothetical protein